MKKFDFDGYCYLYTHFFDNTTLDLSSTSHLEESSKFKVIYISEDFNLAFSIGRMSNELGFVHESHEFNYQIKKFVICSNGLNQPRIRVNLCNVPIYNDKYPEKDSVPYDVSDLIIC